MSTVDIDVSRSWLRLAGIVQSGIYRLSTAVVSSDCSATRKDQEQLSYKYGAECRDENEESNQGSGCSVRR